MQLNNILKLKSNNQPVIKTGQVLAE